jgi:Domain of unknown function (DUF6457)
MAALADAVGTPLLTADEAAAVLDLTREVAHGTVRRFGPLAAYAAGLAIGAATEPAVRTARVQAITDTARRLIAKDSPDA